VLTQPQTFYRHFSNDGNRYGRYLTTDRFSVNTDVIRALALNQEWGNQATRTLFVTLPAGTTVFQGVAAPQTPSACYPGGGQQTFIENSKDPQIVWVEGPPPTVKTFSCPWTSMDSRNTEFLGLIDRAVAVAGRDGGRGQQLVAVLQSLKGKIESGQLEPSGGVLTLGLARQVADTADSLASPLLQAVGEIERFYQERFKE